MWTDNDEIVVHQNRPIDSVAIGNKSFFPERVVNQHDIDIPTFTKRQSLAGSNRDNLDMNIISTFEIRQDLVQQSRIVCACRSCQSQRSPTPRLACRDADQK